MIKHTATRKKTTHIDARLPNVKRPIADRQKHVGKVRRPLQRHGRRVVALDKLLDRLARPGGLVVVGLLARAPVAKDELALLGRHQETGRVADRDSDLAAGKKGQKRDEGVSIDRLIKRQRNACGGVSIMDRASLVFNAAVRLAHTGLMS